MMVFAYAEMSGCPWWKTNFQQLSLILLNNSMSKQKLIEHEIKLDMQKLHTGFILMWTQNVEYPTEGRAF